MWIIQPLEIKKNDAPSGKFRLTATSDEDGGGPYGLCDHEHDSREDAVKCPEAAERSKSYGGWILDPETQMRETFWTLDCDIIGGPREAGVKFATAATPAIAMRICNLLNMQDGLVQPLQNPIAMLEADAVRMDHLEKTIEAAPHTDLTYDEGSPNHPSSLGELIDDLEMTATAHADNGEADYGKPMMAAAGKLRKMSDALKPFADAAAGVDKASADQKRLLGSEISPEASPGWGIRRKHLDAAREILG